MIGDYIFQTDQDDQPKYQCGNLAGMYPGILLYGDQWGGQQVGVSAYNVCNATGN